MDTTKFYELEESFRIPTADVRPEDVAPRPAPRPAPLQAVKASHALVRAGKLPLNAPVPPGP